MIQFGIRILFGWGNEIPRLPDGFALRVRRDSAVTAVKDDIEYLIAMNPPRLVKVLKRDDRCSITCDFDNPIVL